MNPLITPDELVDLLASDTTRVLDVRWQLTQPDGRDDYAEAHIPGAVYVDLDTELSRHGEPSEGRHPLPHLDDLQAAARGWGLNDGDTVVIYDDAGSFAAARAWWLLRGSGVADVRVLDGGIRAWRDAGRPVETGTVTPAPGKVTLGPFTGSVATMTDAAAWPDGGVLIDARAPERFRGEVEPLDPIAGHIPGAVNLPGTVLSERGRLRSASDLREAFASVGATPAVPVAAYCGSGVTAAYTALAGDVAGIDVTVYPGSWSAWSNTPGQPVATGDAPK